MFVFEMLGLAFLCVLLIGFIAAWDALHNGIHPPYDDAIDWPEGHALHRYERRHWRAKRERLPML